MTDNNSFERAERVSGSPAPIVWADSEELGSRPKKIRGPKVECRDEHEGESPEEETFDWSVDSPNYWRH